MHRKRERRQSRLNTPRESAEHLSLLGRSGNTVQCPACGHLVPTVPETPAPETRPTSAQASLEPAAARGVATEQLTNVLIDAERLLGTATPVRENRSSVSIIAAIREVAEKDADFAVPPAANASAKPAEASAAAGANDAPPSEQYASRVLVNVRMAGALLERIQQSGVDLSVIDQKAVGGTYLESVASSMYSVRTSLSLLEASTSAMLTAASDARTPAPSANAMPPPRPLWQPAPPNPPPKSVGGPAEGSAQAERPVEGESHATDDPSKNSQPLAEPSLVAKRFSALESGPEVLLRQISASTSDRNKSLTGMTLGTFGSTTIPPTPLAKQESRRRSSLQVCVCSCGSSHSPLAMLLRICVLACQGKLCV